MFQIEIPRRAKTCKKCENLFISGNEYFSTLFQDTNGYIRNDFCSSCWVLSKKENSNQLDSYWRGVIPVKNETHIVQIKNRDERAMDLLKAALDENTRENCAQVFVLALYLARRKHLILRKELRKSSEEIMSIYEVAATEEMLGIRKMPLTDLQVEEVQKSIAEKLSADG